MAISHCYWHLVVKNGNFTLLLTSSLVKNGNFTLLLTSSGQEWQFHTATDIKWSRMAISSLLVVWHLVIKNGNFTLLLKSSVKNRQFHIATDIKWSRMVISHCYWHLVVKNGNFTLLLTSSHQEWQFTLLLTSIGQEWQFHTATDIKWSRMAISHRHLVIKNGNSHCYSSTAQE